MTPKGLEEKSRLTVKFILRNLREYDRIREWLRDSLTEISTQQLGNIALLAPNEISRLITQVIKEEKLPIQIRHRVKSVDDRASKIKIDEGEGILIAFTGSADKETLAKRLGLAPDRIFYL